MMNVFNCRVGTETASEITGASIRQISYWIRQGIITPVEPGSGKGSVRQFGFVDILRIKVLLQLRNAGISLQRVRAALAKLADWGENDPLVSGRLLAIGERPYWVENEAQLVDIIRQQRAMAPLVLVDLGEIAEETRLEMAAMCAA